MVTDRLVGVGGGQERQPHAHQEREDPVGALGPQEDGDCDADQAEAADRADREERPHRRPEQRVVLTQVAVAGLRVEGPLVERHGAKNACERGAPYSSHSTLTESTSESTAPLRTSCSATSEYTAGASCAVAITA